MQLIAKLSEQRSDRSEPELFDHELIVPNLRTQSDHIGLMRCKFEDFSKYQVLIRRLEARKSQDRFSKTVVRGQQKGRWHSKFASHLLDRVDISLVHSLLIPVDASGRDVLFQSDTHAQLGLRETGGKARRLQPASEMLRRN